MKESKLFETTRDIVGNEKVVDNFLEAKNDMKRKFTINPKNNKKKLSASEKKQSVLFVGDMARTSKKLASIENPDPRPDDEIDELKRIFYKFFVEADMLKDKNDKKITASPQKEPRKCDHGVGEEYRKNTDNFNTKGVTDQLKELYEDQERRREYYKRKGQYENSPE